MVNWQDRAVVTVHPSCRCLSLPELMATATDWIISHSPLVFLVSSRLKSSLLSYKCKRYLIVYLRQRRRYMSSPSRLRSFVCLSVCVQDYSKTRAWICMKCCMSIDVGTWMNWLTFERDRDHSPDAGTGSYMLRNFAALPSLPYFSAISVSICAKLARSILMRDHNTATEPNFWISLSKCRILSPKSS